MHLLESLSKLYPDSSKRTLQQWLQSKRVELNGKVTTTATTPVPPDATITLLPKEKRPFNRFDILHMDRYLIVIEKPDTLLSVPLDHEDKENALHLLQRYFREPHISPVHRLDRDTSGVMVFARTRPAAVKLSAMVQKRELTREYVALVSGKPDPLEGSWDDPIAPDSIHKMKVSPEGKPALTRYKVIRSKQSISLIRLSLHTGKKHQIRLHASHAGHPVLGDERYGAEPAKRLYLHAEKLHFTHPYTKKEMKFLSPIPKGFALR